MTREGLAKPPRLRLIIIKSSLLSPTQLFDMRYLVLLYLLCTSLYQTFAQNHDYVWLLGANGVDNPYYAGTVIDFIGDPPEVYYEFRDIVFFQTNASICDSSGNLLFYTNG
ncbi:MAG: hypothetical protein AAF798_12315, partial [Bacteroidota bacterium]